MKLLFFSSIALFFALPALAAPLPDGWNATHWGMSEAQVTGLYPSIQQAQTPNTFSVSGRDYFSRLSLPNVAISDTPFTARFLTGTTGTLSGVQLISSRSAPEKTQATYEKIKAALVQKYEKPSSEGPITLDARKLDPTSKQVVWEDSHSRITLEYVASGDAPNDPYLIVWYMQLDSTQSAGRDGNL